MKNAIQLVDQPPNEFTIPTIAALPSHRRGAVLIVVLVATVFMTLLVYQFVNKSTTDLEKVVATHQVVQSNYLSQSGADYVVSLLSDPDQYPTRDLYDAPYLFFGQALLQESASTGTGYFTVFVPDEQDETGTLVRYGLAEETAKFNLNTIRNYPKSQQQTTLLKLPGMTEDIADAILDWLDSDDDPRLYGAESDYYLSLNPPYMAANGRLNSLDELLQVRGVTWSLLYGEDANQNGILDPAENDGDLSLPLDNQDGFLDRGWSAWLTVYSRESNVSPEGKPKINLNSDDLVTLYEVLKEQFGEPVARFAIGVRMYGLTQNSSPLPFPVGNTEKEKQAASPPLTTEFLEGIEPKGQFASIYDMIDTTTRDPMSNRPLKSPLESNLVALALFLPDLEDFYTTVDGTWRDGRININTASEEVLALLPDVDFTAIDTILNERIDPTFGEDVIELEFLKESPVWLILHPPFVWNQLGNQISFRKLAPYITSKGSVFRAVVVGQFGDQSRQSRAEIIVDSSEIPAKLIHYRDMSHLGIAYPRQYILPPAELTSE